MPVGSTSGRRRVSIAAEALESGGSRELDRRRSNSAKQNMQHRKSYNGDRSGRIDAISLGGAVLRLGLGV